MDLRSLVQPPTFAVILLSLGCASAPAPAVGPQSVERPTDSIAEAPAAVPTQVPLNIILFISDGCGPASFTLARDFVRTQRGQQTLALDAIQVGSVRTFATNSLITDSASSATAYACGVKTNNGMIGMGPDTTVQRSILEMAEDLGKSTGLVATSRITHATPAAFAAHVPQRSMESEIASQYLDSGVDLLMGGGARFFRPTDEGGSRTDGRNLLNEAAGVGVEIVTTRGGFDRAEALPLIALFTPDHLPYEIDRSARAVPSLAEMTTKAIELLSADEDGFFLMVEGSRIDHAGHGNDLGGHLHDILAYDAAVSEGLRFAREDGQTLVVSVSDHETGGLTLGRKLDGRSIYEWRPEVAGRLRASSDSVFKALDAGGDVREVVSRLTGITDLSDEEVEGVGGSPWQRSAALSELVSRRALVGWTTGGHTAVDVPLFAFGPGSDHLEGNHDNAELGRALIKFMR